MKKWTEEEKQLLKAYNGKTIGEIRRVFPTRNPSSIHYLANTLGITIDVNSDHKPDPRYDGNLNLIFMPTLKFFSK